MEIRTNEEVLEWYKYTVENGRVSEETIKREALKIFKISPDAAKDKKRFKIEVEDFVTKHKNMLRKMEKDCLKESGGSVKSVPADFRPDIEDDRERKKEYLRFARESIRSSKNYQDWLDADCTLFPQSCSFLGIHGRRWGKRHPDWVVGPVLRLQFNPHLKMI